MSDKVVIIKLVTNDELIGVRADNEAQQTDFPTITLKDIRRIVLIPHEQTQSYQLALQPYSPVDPDAPQDFNTRYVLSISAVHSDQLAKAYKDETTGLEVVQTLEQAGIK